MLSGPQDGIHIMGPRTAMVEENSIRTTYRFSYGNSSVGVTLAIKFCYAGIGG